MQPRQWRAGHKPGKMQSAESEVDTTLSEQDKCEIRKSYRNALAPRQHVKILMELYLASREEIEEALGFTHKEARRPIRRHTDAGRPNTYAKHPIEVKRRIVGLVLSGMTYEEAGAMYDVSKNTVANWVMKYRRGELSPIMLKEEKADAKLYVLRQAVISVRVMHAHCWEQKVMELMKTVCDSYCRWPLECRSSEELEENHCNDCVLIQALNLGL